MRKVENMNSKKSIIKFLHFKNFVHKTTSTSSMCKRERKYFGFWVLGKGYFIWTSILTMAATQATMALLTL